jgi:hypothetical protein
MFDVGNGIIAKRGVIMKKYEKDLRTLLTAVPPDTYQQHLSKDVPLALQDLQFLNSMGFLQDFQYMTPDGAIFRMSPLGITYFTRRSEYRVKVWTERLIGFVAGVLTSVISGLVVWLISK